MLFFATFLAPLCFSQQNSEIVGFEAALQKARNYQERYDYNKALQLYEQLIGQTEGKDSVAYFRVVHEAAKLYYQKVNYAKAEILLSNVLAFNKRKFGMESILFAEVCDDLALVYREQGNYQKAEQFHLKALSIYENKLKKLSQPYATTCLHLAELYKAGGRYNKAEPYLREAELILGHVLKRKHPRYASALIAYGDYHQYKKRFAMAETAWKTAREIYTQNYGKQSLAYGNSCLLLANLATLQNNYQNALKLYKEVKSIYQNILNPLHPEYAFFLNSYALFYQKFGFYEKAQPVFLELIDTRLEELKTNFYTLSESEKLKYIERNEAYFQSFYAFTAKGFKKMLGANVEVQMAKKGLILNETQNIQKTILASQDNDLIAKYEGWKQIKQLLALSYSLPQDKKQEFGINGKELESKANQLEKQLTAMAHQVDSKYGLENLSGKNYSLSVLQNALGEEEAAIEIVKTDTKQGNKTIYIALIIEKTRITPALLTNIDEKADLAFYRNAIKFETEDKQSYYKFWEVISQRLGAGSTVFFSPQGIYNFINLYTIYNPRSGKYLLEEISLHYVTNLREVIDAKNKIKDSNKTKMAALFGRPIYKNVALVKNSRRNIGAISNEQISFESLPDLKETETEVKKISQLLQSKNWKTEVFLGEKATEETLKEVYNPTVLHIASHGYFVELQNQDPTQSMLYAGVILSNRQNSSNAEDGVLTAYEAATLNLQGTELVVMSACETGLGQVASQEGVYGLQRGFRVAGAENVLMSLWKVDDKATQLLMDTFFKEWTSGKSKQEALKIAQIKIKETYKNPLFWGAFLLVGE